MPEAVCLFWFRRDLRLRDNAGLFHALSSGRPVVPVFIFDKIILEELEECADRRVQFIHTALHKLQEELVRLGSTLDVRHGKPPDVFENLLQDYDVRAVYTNEDYEPYARQRDELIRKKLDSRDIPFLPFKDQVIFAKSEVAKKDGTHYSVFTPYAKRWKAEMRSEQVKSFRSGSLKDRFYRQAERKIPTLKVLGFSGPDAGFNPSLLEENIPSYHLTRDLPSLAGTTRIGIHLRFGTVSVRQWVGKALKQNETFLDELIWREFFMQILWHAPHVVTKSYRPAYDHIRWRNKAEEFQAWCEGRTGYPIVDAGMRELNTTGFMHNRVRMITASFLVKHLLIDWRWGEAYFASRLLDYELSSNNGNWQWVAGCGCDAAPYFRFFSPARQAKRFDPKEEYIRQWVPELGTTGYPKPMIVHEAARERCLKAYRKALATAER